MLESDRIQALLFADVALTLGVADARAVANALQHYWEDEPKERRPIAEALEAAGALSVGQREQVQAEVRRLVGEAEGDPGVALARRGGIDRSIHASLGPATSKSLLQEGAGARAPLRVVDQERYTDFSLVGKGGMGVVYLALDTELNRRVAFKMVRPDPGAPKETPAPEQPLQVTPPTAESAGAESTRSFEELKLRFLQEAWVTGAMEHPGVVPVYELGRTDAGIPYYTMRYVKGERTLATAIKAADDLDARLALLEPFLKMCDAVRYAHSRGVMHRDLKPENIALGEFGEVVVLDWGLSKMKDRPDVSGSMWQSRIEELRDATDLQTVAGALGTPGYMAPEAALGQSEDVDHKSDIFSLGAILFEILTGRPPHRFKTFMEYIQKMLEEATPHAHDVAEEVPLELSEACARAMARQKADRFESVDELATAVRRWQTEGRLKLQIDELVEAARTELRAARKHGGNLTLWHLDRATAACTRVLHLKKDHTDALALMGEIKLLRDEGIQEQVSAGRRRLIVAVGFLVLALATVVTLVVASIFAGERREAEARMRDSQEQLAAKDLEVRTARLAAEDAKRRRARLYASLSRQLLAEDRVAAARVAAAQALAVRPTPAAWGALAAAEARWTPALRAVLEDVVPGPVAFDPRGATLFVCGAEGVRAYDVAAARFGPTYVAHGEGVRLLQVSPDGRRLLVAGKERLEVFDTASGDLETRLPAGDDESDAVRELARTAGPVTAAAFSHDGESLFTGHQASTLVQWDLHSGSVRRVHQETGGAAFTALRESADGEFLYFGDADGSIGQRRTSALDAEISYDAEGGRVVDIQPSAENDVVYACTTNHNIFLFELDPPALLTHYDGPEYELAFAIPLDDHKRLFTVDAAGGLAFWSTEDRRPRARLVEFGNHAFGAALAERASRLAVAFRDGVYLFDLGTGDRGAAESITASCRVGDRLIVARPDFSIEAWDTAAGRSIARWPAHEATITAVATDGGRIFSASLDGILKVWPIDGGDAIAALPGPLAPSALAVGEEGRLYTGSVDGTVEVFSWLLRRKMGRLAESGELPVIALVAREGRLAAYESASDHRVWDLQTRDRLREDLGPLVRARPQGKLPPIQGEPVDWILKDAKLRLIATENRTGLKLDGASVVAVPPADFRPRQPRIDPWSR